MTESTPSASEGPPASSPPSAPAKANQARWGIALFIAALAAWVLINYPPIRFQIPEELRMVDNYSPQHLQDEAAAAVTEVYWKTSVLKLTLVGFCLGLVPVLAATWPLKGRQRVAVLAGAISGPVFGLLAALLGLGLRYLMGPDGMWSGLGEGDRILMGDTVVFVLLSAVLVLPMAIALLLQGGEGSQQRAGATLLAAVVAGGAVPMVASFVVPAQQTNVYPPAGGGLTAIWFLLMAVLLCLLPSMIGEKKPKASEQGEVVPSEG